MELKYKPPVKEDFLHSVNKKVNAYFEINKLSRKTNSYGLFKAFFFIFAYAFLVFIIYTTHLNSTLISAYALLGFVQICLVLNLGHEGVHSSFSKNQVVNKLMAYSFDVIGSSGYLWKMRHVYSHHPYPMVPNHDVDIQQSNMLTFVPMENPKKIYRYQQLYVPFLYCFYTLNAIFKRDWEDYFSNRIGDKVVKHTKLNTFIFIFSKFNYFTYALILPLIYSSCSWTIIIIGFLFMHIVASLSAAVALFPAHLHEDSIFPVPGNNGELDTTWAEHQMNVTIDFGTRWPLVAFFFGGINYHAVHHLFPTIAHVHFPEIRKIMHATAKEHGISYLHKPSLNVALISHWKLLKKNGISQLNEVF